MHVARCFCAVGAIYRAAHEIGPKDPIRARGTANYWLSRAIGLPKGAVVPDWNDAPTTTHGHVLRAFDRAIEMLRDRAGELL